MKRRLMLQFVIAVFAITFVGCAAPVTTQATAGVTTYSHPAWVGVAWMAVGLVIAIVGGSAMTGASTAAQATEPTPDSPAEESKPASPFLTKVFCLAIVLLGVWVGGVGGVNCFRDEVALSESGARWSVGTWFAPDRFEFNFEDIEAIQTRQEETGFGRRRTVKHYADFVYKTGERQTTAVDVNILRRAWPDIVAKAAAKGVDVDVAGDEFTD